MKINLQQLNNGPKTNRMNFLLKENQLKVLGRKLGKHIEKFKGT